MGSSPYLDEIRRKLPNVRSAMGADLWEGVTRVVEENAERFPVIGPEVCLVHSDFYPGNLRQFQGKAYVFDWEYAHAGSPLLDFAVYSRYYENLEELAEGYREAGGELPPDWFTLVRLLDVVNTVQLLDTRPERPKLFALLRKKLVELVHG